MYLIDRGCFYMLFFVMPSLVPIYGPVYRRFTVQCWFPVKFIHGLVNTELQKMSLMGGLVFRWRSFNCAAIPRP